MRFIVVCLLSIVVFSSCNKDEFTTNNTVPVSPLANATVQEHLDYGLSVDSIMSLFPADSVIGKIYGGGLIFYVNVQTGSGLVAAFSDQSIASEWGCEGTNIFGADSLTLGTGMYNNDAINNGCGTAAIAADICDYYSNDSFLDWYLPNKNELAELYYSIGTAGFGDNFNLGNFAYENYWTSNDFDNDQAWCLNFSSGVSSVKLKGETARVRPIRAFN